jgi:hypothetical protein
MSRLAVVCFIVLTASFSVAQSKDKLGTQNGTTLLANCAHAARDDADPTAPLPSEDGFCYGYILGVEDASGHTHCRPEGTTMIQNVRVVVKWLRDHPERLHERADTLILQALKTAFPCKQR